MAELGNTLSRARRARGISLEDAERDTHVSRRYLNALETEDFSVFPAPVYARGFLRTYSRYLGLNPDELLRVFPTEDLVVDIAPLPTVSRPPQQLINVNWVVAGLVVIFLLGAGLLLFQGNGGGGNGGLTQGTGQTALNGNGGQGAVSPQGTISGGQVQMPSISGSTTAAVTGKQIGPTTPGELPDLIGADVTSSRAYLNANQIRYSIIEFVDTQTARGIVMGQTPNAGSRTNANTTVTLYVSAGPSLGVVEAETE